MTLAPVQRQERERGKESNRASDITKKTSSSSRRTKSRVLRILFIVCFLSIQSLPPLRYYYHFLLDSSIQSELARRLAQSESFSSRFGSFNSFYNLSSSSSSSSFAAAASPSHTRTIFLPIANQLFQGPSFSSTGLPNSTILAAISSSLVSVETLKRLPTSPSSTFLSLDRTLQSLYSIAAPFLFGQGPDLFDERFCWRMFSSVSQLLSCDVGFSTRRGPSASKINLDLQQIGVHQAWIQLLQSCKSDIRRRITAELCHQAPSPALALFRTTHLTILQPQEPLIAARLQQLEIELPLFVPIEEEAIDWCHHHPQA